MRRPSSAAVAAVLACAALVTACRHRAEADADAEPQTVYGDDRPATLLRPPVLEPGRRYPLVLVLHGYGAMGAWQLLYLQLDRLAADGRALVLAPDGTLDGSRRRFWNAGACCQFGGAPVDDVAYLGGLLDGVLADWPVDPSRVLVVGHSNGHFMAYRLACDRADVVTAIAGLAGAAPLDPGTCRPSRPVSALHVHGTADEVIAYAGGTLAGAYPGAEASFSQWAAHAGCASTTAAGAPLDLESSLAGAETAPRAAEGCPSGVGVELWTIEGGRHIPTFGPEAFGPRVFEWLAAHPRP
jgi:polyhydroxybutyrate depolymerase